VELPRHDVILAEGLPVESYLDTGNRAIFENGGLPLRLHPDLGEGSGAREQGSCVPFVSDPAVVEPVWRMLSERAVTLGWDRPEPAATVADPVLHLLVGSRSVRPLHAHDGRYVFAIPANDAVLRLVSRSACPRDTRPWATDERRLGVLVRRMSVRQHRAVHELVMDDPMLDQGWWQVEWHADQPCRWTDGNANLPIKGPAVLEVRLGGSMPYRTFDKEPAGRAGFGRDKSASAKRPRRHADRRGRCLA
jgi:hypothetical protein